jgi:copper homeostasis protein
MREIRVELSVDTLAGALAADRAGADRIELCAATLDGGLTPSHGLIAAAVARCTAPVHVLIRPRGGDFSYSDGELTAMIADATHAVELGTAGVVSGALTEDGTVHKAATAALVDAAGAAEFTFHRAIDVCAEPLAALDVLGELGVRRVLSSGAAPTAMLGAGVLSDMVRRATPGLTVMACGGIRPDNVMDVVRATGVRDVHAAPRIAVRGWQRQGGWTVTFTSGNPPAGYDRYDLDEQSANELCELADSYPW